MQTFEPTLPLSQLRRGLAGRVISPEDAEYDTARSVFYTGLSRRPAAIVRVANPADVAHVVTLARESGVELAVRGGGHSLAGHSSTDGGVVLDLSEMRQLTIDPDTRTAWAQTGLTAGEYTTAVGEHGLATGFGDAGSVGIGGVTLGGGIGFLVRRHGMTIDSLLGAEIVTADGQLLSVDADHHPDLFWAIRGGGGNFGVATRLHFRLHPVATVLGGMLLLPARPDVITGLVAVADAAPEELSVIANVMIAPPMPMIPAQHHGSTVVAVLLAYAGDITAGERAVAPLRNLAAPLADMLRPMRYPEMFEMGEAPHPVAMSVHSQFVDDVTPSAAQLVIEQLQASTAPMAAVQIRVLGGALARVPAEATAFAHRSRRIMLNVAAAYENLGTAAEHDAWVETLAGALRQGERGVYTGFLGAEGEERTREAYPGDTWDRLSEIKARYDPTNLFRLNQNVPPAPTTER